MAYENDRGRNSVFGERPPASKKKLANWCGKRTSGRRKFKEIRDYGLPETGPRG